MPPHMFIHRDSNHTRIMRFMRFAFTEALIDAILSDVHAAHNHLDEGAAASSKELPFLQPGSSSTGGAAAEATAAAASALAASE